MGGEGGLEGELETWPLPNHLTSEGGDGTAGSVDWSQKARDSSPQLLPLGMSCDL